MNREAFEKIPEIAQLIEEGKDDNLIFVPETNKYEAEMYITFTPDYVHFLNGAWMMYQEQQKKVSEVINMMMDVYTEVSTTSIKNIEAMLQ